MEMIDVKRKRASISQDIKIKKEYEKFILKNDHPCMMAKTVFSMDKVELKTYQELGSLETAKRLFKDLENYIEKYNFESNDFKTFMAVFPESPEYSEISFEKLLWKQLQYLHNLDDKRWDPEVSTNSIDENFSFSIGGKAFYIVGLHPNSSRLARQSPYPTLTFNLHWQFEKLREMGSYEAVRDRIRDRDIKLQGNINPMLEDFGNSSEAKQYSGRKVEKEWKCPFHHNN
ncbi:guanitoxin biosynthesis heme-dependent pre-guanitoxin N-hydroxylase GntA [Christiangramia sp. SM2212]|uniref:Guanitoxin biosynthesis heme-dependent pre-guanitoxin N-hydroxylase GntA n=1 Tax=Christiangramia sediminicola TaxID=3073267 RepID=A0ABU1ELF7_9FLAO|nr:guanitoxin biosynthesis heme-dependent pre-guanitoxin N-hydroxylase GntA [Christiangramia sp. SM2212]MDR5589218.1 guanitoxin biosynthesis heme-dependent pre-guanitoxin N-hydroxylase GntA [Christiangramia sp. SM2212]